MRGLGGLGGGWGKWYFVGAYTGLYRILGGLCDSESKGVLEYLSNS